jgi:hypothetical protein
MSRGKCIRVQCVKVELKPFFILVSVQHVAACCHSCRVGGRLRGGVGNLDSLDSLDNLTPGKLSNDVSRLGNLSFL